MSVTNHVNDGVNGAGSEKATFENNSKACISQRAQTTELFAPILLSLLSTLDDRDSARL
jgi:hypothetical protein